jgi:type IV pilus modification protein PilV
MPLIRRTPRARGFSMLEALLALAVLSVGLLGAAAMLLDSLRIHGSALHRLGATQLVRDMADRIRANLHARSYYDTRVAALDTDCDEPGGCNAMQRAAIDRNHFESSARALFAHQDFAASVEFAPAIGPAALDRYVISLRWRDSREDSDDTDIVALQVLAQLPVAG